MADAWHHRSDALSSVGALVGIAGARMGIAVLDPVASLVICIFIVKAAAGIFRDAVDRMVDKSCDDGTVEAMRRVALETEPVLGVDDIRTRMFGPRVYVDIEISADPSLRLDQAHGIAPPGARRHRGGISPGQTLHGPCEPLCRGAGGGGSLKKDRSADQSISLRTNTHKKIVITDTAVLKTTNSPASSPSPPIFSAME